MKELIDKTIALRSKCRDYGEKVNGLLGYSTDSDDPRSGCFGMVFNKSTLCLELLAYYYKLWGKPPARLTSEEVEEKKKENAQRCIELLKFLFVMSMSSIEFSTKASITYYRTNPFTTSLLDGSGRFVYLSNIIHNSESQGLLQDLTQA